MLSERSVVLDLDGFRYKKNTLDFQSFRQLAITTAVYSDSLIFLPPVSFNSFPKLKQKA